MGYYDKYFKEYKRIMDPKENWIKHMNKLSLSFFYSSPIVIGLLVSSVLFIMYYFFRTNVIGISVISILGISCISFYLKKMEKYIGKQKDYIASNVYGYTTWLEKYEEDKNEFRRYLEQDIHNVKQIEAILKSIDDDMKKNRSNKYIFGGSVIIGCLIPVWAGNVNLIYDTYEYGTAFSAIAIQLLMIILLWAVVNFIRNWYVEMKESKFIKLKLMQMQLMEMHLELLGKE